jgi:xylan 1,4-beta-xylosidase
VASGRVDEAHANVAHTWSLLGGGDWPTDDQWEALRDADSLPIEYLADVEVGADGNASVTVEVPMPGIRSLRLTRR